MKKLLAFAALSVLSFVGTAKAADIVDTAAGNPDFSTLVKAVQAAGLVDALKGPGPFTVFAPTNEAFAKLPAGALDGLLADKEKLAAVLKYHVVSGKVMAADVKTMKAKSLQGSDISVKKSASGVMVDNAKVTKTDIVCDNGVIHVIDTVIMPKMGKMSKKAATR